MAPPPTQLRSAAMSAAKNKIRLTKLAIDALKPKPKGYLVWDTEVQNFCVRVLPSGEKSFLIDFTLHRRKRKLTIGRYGQWNLDKARQRARELLLEVARGEDPAAKEERADEITVAELCDRFITEGPIDNPEKRASSWKNDQGYLTNHVKPLLGRRTLGELKPADLSKLQSDVLAGKTAKPPVKGNRGRGVRGGRGAAAHVIKSFSAALTWAVMKGWIPDNPAGKIKKIKDGRRDRYLSAEEKNRLIDAFIALRREGEISDQQYDILSLIALTAARRGEILALKWSEVDLTHGYLILPPARHKTGGATIPKRISINPEARTILAQIASREDRHPTYVFPAQRSDSGHVEAVRHSWSKILERAGIENMTVHDFRHAYASFAINSGAPLAHIGINLGHSKPTTTERYAHLTKSVGQPVADSVGVQYRALIDGREISPTDNDDVSPERP